MNISPVYSDFRGAATVQPMMKNFLNFLVLIHIYTLLYFLFMTIIHYDEKFFEFFDLDSYIHIVMFSVLKSIIKNLRLYIQYCIMSIQYSYIWYVSLCPFLYPISLYSINYTHALLLFFYCRILSDINALFLSYCRNILQYIKIKDIPIKYTPLFIVLIYSFQL